MINSIKRSWDVCVLLCSLPATWKSRGHCLNYSVRDVAGIYDINKLGNKCWTTGKIERIIRNSSGLPSLKFEQFAVVRVKRCSYITREWYGWKTFWPGTLEKCDNFLKFTSSHKFRSSGFKYFPVKTAISIRIVVPTWVRGWYKSGVTMRIEVSIRIWKTVIHQQDKGRQQWSSFELRYVGNPRANYTGKGRIIVVDCSWTVLRCNSGRSAS